MPCLEHFPCPTGFWFDQDLSGRPHLSCQLDIPTERIGTFDTQLVEHFFQSLVNTSGMTLHIRQVSACELTSQLSGLEKAKLTQVLWLIKLKQMLECSLVEFFITEYVLQLNGKNSHHIVEATFKAFARALRQAVEPDPRREGMIASSKGVLTQH